MDEDGEIIDEQTAIELFNVSWRDCTSSKINQQELARSYDSISHIYNKACPIETLLPISDAFFKLNLPKNTKVLDLCAGTGRLGPLLLEKGGYTNIDALDCSEKSLDVARNTGVYQHCYCQFFDPVDNPTFPDGMYDVVFVCNAFLINHLNSKFFSEITRIIRPGGFFAFKIREAYTASPCLKTFVEDVEKQVEKRIWQPVIEMFRVEPKPGYRGPDGRPYIYLHYIMKKL